MNQTHEKRVVTCPGCGLIAQTACEEYRCPMCNTHIIPAKCDHCSTCPTKKAEYVEFQKLRARVA